MEPRLMYEARALIDADAKRAVQKLVDRIAAALRKGDDREARRQDALLREVQSELDRKSRFGSRR